MRLHEIPGKLTVEWRDDLKAIVDTWTNYYVSLDEFREAILEKGLPHASKNGGRAWIVDSRAAKGSFPPEIQNFIGTDIFPNFAKNGIKYFITILPESAIVKLTVKNYSSKAGPNGLELVETKSLEDAVAFLQSH